MDTGIRDYWIRYLARLRLPLYAVLDAARNERVLPLVRQLGTYASLLADDALADVAPYLVALSPSHNLFERFVAESWGDAWGVYLTSRAPFAAVYSHVQHISSAVTEGGERMLLRFYDPRVLRALIPVCTPDEVDELLGPIDRFVVESRAATWAWELSRDDARAARVGAAA